MTADPFGILDGYWSAEGEWFETPPETRDALRQLMGAGDADAPPPAPPSWFVRHGSAPSLWGPCELLLEDGTRLRAESALPPDLPLGYHWLHPLDGGPPTWLVVSPAAAHLPPRLHRFGFAAQLYAARSRDSWGIGDLGDLARLGSWAASRGAGALMLNPLHAAAPVEHQQPSPYYPTSRLYRNLLFLDIPAVPWAQGLGDELAAAAAAGRALNDRRRIDRDAVWRIKSAALEAVWRRFIQAASDDEWAELDRYTTGEGPALTRFAVWCALAERHGPGWQSWPAELRHPDSPAVADEARRLANRVRFHQWCQWLLDRQLVSAAGAAGDALALISDLAVGFDPGGADAWAFQDDLALGARVGAPPDTFNADGQDWGLPPFVPWKLQHRRFEPLRATIRAAFRHTGGVRIDHVMGLFRLYWIPPEAGPAEGGYVRYPFRELLELVTLESVRAGAFVVGEDLGTVEDEVRTELGDRSILSYRLMWFEPEQPEDYPVQALAAVTTHDLPTIAGVLSGADIAAQRAIGLTVKEDAAASLRTQLETVTGLDAETPTERFIVESHRRLGAAASMVVVATLDDLLCVEERPNMQGTVDEWPNWSLALPVPLDDLDEAPLVTPCIEAMAQGRAESLAAAQRPRRRRPAPGAAAHSDGATVASAIDAAQATAPATSGTGAEDDR